MIKHYAVIHIEAGDANHRITIPVDNTSIISALDSVRKRIEPFSNIVQCKLVGIHFYDEEEINVKEKNL